MAATIFLAALSVMVTFSLSRRIWVPVLWAFRWRLPARFRLSLPLAVTRKRFLVPLWVFCLGMGRRLPAVSELEGYGAGRRAASRARLTAAAPIWGRPGRSSAAPPGGGPAPPCPRRRDFRGSARLRAGLRRC